MYVYIYIYLSTLAYWSIPSMTIGINLPQVVGLHGMASVHFLGRWCEQMSSPIWSIQYFNWRYLLYIRPYKAYFLAYVRGYTPNFYGLIWYSTSILGSWFFFIEYSSLKTFVSGKTYSSKRLVSDTVISFTTKSYCIHLTLKQSLHLTLAMMWKI